MEQIELQRTIEAILFAAVASSSHASCFLSVGISFMPISKPDSAANKFT